MGLKSLFEVSFIITFVGVWTSSLPLLVLLLSHLHELQLVLHLLHILVVMGLLLLLGGQVALLELGDHTHPLLLLGRAI